MSGALAPRALRVLRRLALNAEAALVPAADGFVLPMEDDRRRRPVLRISASQADELVADGALAQDGARLRLTAAGRARIARAEAPEEGARFRAQHGGLEERLLCDDAGVERFVRAASSPMALRRLAQMRTPAGEAFFERAEIAAAERLCADRDLAASGALKGQDWSAPPRGAAPRGAGGGPETAHVAAIDARARLDAALKSLAAPLARTLRAVVLEERGLESLEAEGAWPARSGKVALKLALAQLARHYGFLDRRGV